MGLKISKQILLCDFDNLFLLTVTRGVNIVKKPLCAAVKSHR